MNPRVCALKAVAWVVQRRARIDEALAKAGLVQIRDPRDRRLAHFVAYGALRWWWRLAPDWGRFVRRTPPPVAQAALAIGAFQLRVLHTPPHAAVGETVAAVRVLAPRLAPLVNAVLRRVAEEEPSLGRALPAWVVRRWEHAYGGERVAAIERAMLAVPWIALRLRVPRDAWLEEARALGVEARPAEIPQAVLVRPPVDVRALPGYASGAFFVSDLAAQRALEAFAPEGEVLELCAAPGGKTAQLAEKTSRVVSVELDAARITTLMENLSRLGIRDRVRIVRADARRLPFKDASTSAIVLDAPCSASGVARRRPDVWFRHTPETIARFARTQRAMLAEAWRVLAPGGKLLYIVCSLHPEETRAVVQDLTPDAECHWLWPDEVQDGFFCALIQKR